MRIVVSGTHASGKSTLVSDFALRHPDFTVLPDPFELIDEAWDSPNASMFAAQLRIAADRLGSDEFGADLIAERGPLDFLAYLLALDAVAGESGSSELLERAALMTSEALGHVDLLVVLPLTTTEPIEADSDEYLELREAMNDVLLELIEDSDLIGPRATVVEIVGGRGERLSVLESLVSELGR